MRSIIIVIALILWFLLGYFYFQSCKTCCHDNALLIESSEDTISSEVNENKEPLLFDWNTASPITGDQWEIHRNQLLNNLGGNQQLEIIGFYREDESNNTDFENLGLARAHETAKLFTPPLSDNQIKKSSKLISNRDRPEGLFESVQFSIINMEKAENKIGIDDEMVIFFPYNSTNKLNDLEVENYLNQLVERLSQTNERVQLTGHTDNTGPESANEKLGLWRANVIRDYLLSKGLDNKKIITITRGESAPSATNETDEGRAKTGELN